MLPRELIELIIKYRSKLLKQVNDSTMRLIRAYASIDKRAKPYIKAVQLKIASTENITPTMIKRTEEFSELMGFLEYELPEYTSFVRIELDLVSIVSIELAIAQIQELSRKLQVPMQIIAPDAIDFLVSYLAPEGELMKRIAMWAPNVYEKVSNAIIEGVANGRNPAVIAREIAKQFGIGLTDSIRTMRTVQLYSYREATRANYIVNSDVVIGWTWYAQLDSETCAACIALHGTFHTLEESLDDHYNGRCAMIPVTKTLGRIQYTDGVSWFNEQPEDYQEKILGIGKYEAWKAGKFELSQVAGHHDDPVYGDMRVVESLKNLVSID